MTRSKYIAGDLDKRCDGRHEHIELMEGRAADVAVYPRALCEHINRATLRRNEYDKKGLACVCRGTEREQGFVEVDGVKDDRMDDTWRQ